MNDSRPLTVFRNRISAISVSDNLITTGLGLGSLNELSHLEQIPPRLRHLVPGASPAGTLLGRVGCPHSLFVHGTIPLLLRIAAPLCALLSA